MGRLALVAGSSLRDTDLPQGEWELVQRHGEAVAYALPHRIDHVANMRSLAESGCDRVLAVSSVGGLREELGPGSLLCPDDFIALDAEPLTALEGAAAHRVPGFNAGWRRRVLAALDGEGARDGGVYWQARGPRLETPAEVRFVAAHADVIGMTVASECVVAGELGLAYAALCVVDNLANGIADSELTLDQIEANRERNRARIAELVSRVLPALAAAS